MQLTELKPYINNITRCLGILDILSADRQDHQFNSLTSVLLSYKSIVYKSKSPHPTSLWYSINFRAIYRPSLIKPLIYYQFKRIIQHRIQRDSYLLSNSEQYPQNIYTLFRKNPTRFWSILFKTWSHRSSIWSNIWTKTLDWFLSHLTERVSRKMRSKK